ncbi:MAG: chloride channel protein [Bacteroidota bacterium]
MVGFKEIKQLVRWLQVKLTKKQFIILSSVLVGLSAGAAAIVLKTFVHYIFIAASLNEKFGIPYLYLFLPLVGILLTVLVVKKALKSKLEKGISPIHYAIAHKSSIIPREQMYAQIITSSLTVGFGGSAGLEAPIVVTGAAFGSNYSKAYKLNYKDRTLLLGCGVAAGIAAAFNAPIAGVLFALEVLLLDVSISAFTPLIISAATGTLIAKIVLDDDILLSFQLQQAFNYYNVPFYILLGVFAGLVSVYHSRTFMKVEGIFSKSKNKIWLNAIFGGLLLAALIFVFPSLFGEGYKSIKILSLQDAKSLLDGSVLSVYRDKEWFVLLFVGILVFIKSIATALTLGSGGNGGNFAPSLFVGAYLGFFFSRLINLLGITALPISNFTIVGMAGILSGIYHAPLTAIFLIAEITGGYTLMIPLMIVSSISYAISKHFEPYSMDTKKLANSGQMFTNDKDKNILTTIKIANLIEDNFQSVLPTDSLGDLVKIISQSKRNLFPVIDTNNKLIGIITLDDIREIMFNTDMHSKISVGDLMVMPAAIIDSYETMESVMKKFDETGAWNLPVTTNGVYTGFISKSSVFSSYRTKLITTTIE